MNSYSQNESILKALQLGDSITQRDAIERWNVYRLSGRIFDLRHGVYDGVSYDIEEVSEPNDSGKGRHARYRLRAAPPAPAASLPNHSILFPGCPAFPPKVEQKPTLFQRYAPSPENKGF
jgi:hypothetical protein